MPERARQKRKGAYHHGDLGQALVQAALDTIREESVEALTLRSVGARVGVSRTALYRHFDDKAALVARVAAEGFRLLGDTMTRAVANSSPDQGDTLQVMAAAYVHFALVNQSHYQTMFGGFPREWDRYPDLVQNAEAAFNQLADALRDEQRRGRIRDGNAVELAEMAWSLSHGIATLALAHRLPRASMSVEELAVWGCGFLQTGMRLA